MGMEVVIPSNSRAGVCSHSYLYRIHHWYRAYFKCDIRNILQQGGLEATLVRMVSSPYQVAPPRQAVNRKERKIKAYEPRQTPIPPAQTVPAPTEKGKETASAGDAAPTAPKDWVNYQELEAIFKCPDDLKETTSKDPLAGMTPEEPKEIERALQYVAVQRLLRPSMTDAEIQLGFYSMEIDTQTGQSTSTRHLSYQSRVQHAKEEGARMKKKPIYGGFDALLGSSDVQPSHSLGWWLGLKSIESERSVIRPPSPEKPSTASGSRSERSGIFY